MRMKIVGGLTAAAIGAALATGLSTQAQAVAPANYSRACTKMFTSEAVASEGLVQKAVTAYGVGRRSARRTARRTSRRHSY